VCQALEDAAGVVGAGAQPLGTSIPLWAHRWRPSKYSAPGCSPSIVFTSRLVGPLVADRHALAGIERRGDSGWLRWLHHSPALAAGFGLDARRASRLDRRLGPAPAGSCGYSSANPPGRHQATAVPASAAGREWSGPEVRGPIAGRSGWPSRRRGTVGCGHQFGGPTYTRGHFPSPSWSQFGGVVKGHFRAGFEFRPAPQPRPQQLSARESGGGGPGRSRCSAACHHGPHRDRAEGHGSLRAQETPFRPRKRVLRPSQEWLLWPPV